MPKITLTPFTVNPKAMHELIIMPQFADSIDDISGDLIPSDEEGDWMVMDNVVYQRPIMDLFGNQNVLKRRDATCKLIYTPVGRLGLRYVTTEKLYAATEDCVEEFYQGSFQDYQQGNFDTFFENVMPILEKGIGTDIYTNKYFGDVTRFSDATGKWSWNKFDGIFTWIGKYISDGTIPSAQTFTIPSGTLTPTQANAALASAYNSQDSIMESWDDMDKCFYVDKKLAEAYYAYLVASGQTMLAQRMADGTLSLMYNGIMVKVKKWDAVLKALHGGVEAHAVILTLKGNFLYAADSAYGAPNTGEAIKMWYSDDDDVWRKKVYLKAGTQIVAPQFISFGMTS